LAQTERCPVVLRHANRLITSVNKGVRVSNNK